MTGSGMLGYAKGSRSVVARTVVVLGWGVILFSGITSGWGHIHRPNAKAVPRITPPKKTVTSPVAIGHYASWKDKGWAPFSREWQRRKGGDRKVVPPEGFLDPSWP